MNNIYSYDVAFKKLVNYNATSHRTVPQYGIHKYGAISRKLQRIFLSSLLL